MKNLLFIIVTLLLVSSCQSQVPDLKSPCVGAENSPCGPKIRVNDNWLS